MSTESTTKFRNDVSVATCKYHLSELFVLSWYHEYSYKTGRKRTKTSNSVMGEQPRGKGTISREKIPTASWKIIPTFRCVYNFRDLLYTCKKSKQKTPQPLIQYYLILLPTSMLSPQIKYMQNQENLLNFLTALPNFTFCKLKRTCLFSSQYLSIYLNIY